MVPNRTLAVELLLLTALCCPFAAQGQQRTTLTLQSQPGVEVLWEGVRIGAIEEDGQLVIRNVPAGEFEIRLSKPGYQYRAEAIHIEGSEAVVQSLPLAALEPQALPVEVAGVAVDSVPKGRVHADRDQVLALPEPPQTEPQAATSEQDVASLSSQRETPENAGERRVERDPEVPIHAELTESTLSVAERDALPAQRESVARPGPRSSGTLVLLAVGVLGSLFWVFHKRLPLLRQAAEAVPTAEPQRPAWDPPPPESPTSAEPQDVLKELRRRERELDDESQGRPGVIEVEFVEISDPEERPS